MKQRHLACEKYKSNHMKQSTKERKKKNEEDKEEKEEEEEEMEVNILQLFLK